jgi:SAM-dependent methyltransferase
MTKGTGIVLIAQFTAEHRWVHRTGRSTRMRDRLSASGELHWLAVLPEALDERKRADFGGGPWQRRSSERSERARLRKVRKRAPDGIDRIVGSDQVVAALVEHGRSRELKRLAIVEDLDTTMTPEGVALAVGRAETTDADLLHCPAVPGVTPLVVSVALLERWLAIDPSPRLSTLLTSPAALAEHGRLVELELVDSARLPGTVRCRPLRDRESALLEFWEEHAPDLAAALASEARTPGQSREALTDLLVAYRKELSPGLETYRVEGDLTDVEELRASLETTSAPLVDHFVLAAHMVRLLRRYAGLTPCSHVIDVGCNWGYLALALANLLDEEGEYLGVEVQLPAVRWAQERLAWLGDRFRFAHVDIQNDFYNPAGRTTRGAARIPADDDSADVIVLGSVFTHMQEDGIRAYLKEFRRTLRPGGVAAFSYFDSTSFWHGEETLIADPEVPDKATVYSRNRIAQMLRDTGLETAREPVNLQLFERTDYQTWYFAILKAQQEKEPTAPTRDTRDAHSIDPRSES